MEAREVCFNLCRRLIGDPPAAENKVIFKKTTPEMSEAVIINTVFVFQQTKTVQLQ